MKIEKKYSIVDQKDNCPLINKIISMLENDYIMTRVNPNQADYIFHFIKGKKF